MAQLHEHSSAWSLPKEFTRRRWDADGLFGESAGLGIPTHQAWNLLNPDEREILEEVARRTGSAMRELDRMERSVGLIHADLHLDNVLFHRGRARAIDFDDCGFGHWIYDLSVPLAEWLERKDWQPLRNALFTGYAEVRPLPEEQLVHLETFMAARQASLALWTVARAEENPRFRARRSVWLEWTLRYPRRYLDRPPS
jgi:Ser/Thr protein kinase RdoA (MazF antagonist)